MKRLLVLFFSLLTSLAIAQSVPVTLLYYNFGTHIWTINAVPSPTKTLTPTATPTGTLTPSATPTATPVPTNSGYALYVQSALLNAFSDAQTIYFGGINTIPIQTPGISRIYVPKAGTIKSSVIYLHASTGGTNEDWPVYIRLNDTTDYLIGITSTSNVNKLWSNFDGLTIPVSAGDFLEIKLINPTWSVNPADGTFGGSIFVR